MDACVNCDDPAATRHTLVFETGPTLRDRPLCRGCRAFFDRSGAIEVLEAAVLMRGGEDRREPES